MARESERWARLGRLLRARAPEPGGESIGPEELALLCGEIETTPELNERHADSVLIGLGERRAGVLRAMYRNRYGDPRADEGERYVTSGFFDLVREQEMAAAGEE